VNGELGRTLEELSVDYIRHSIRDTEENQKVKWVPHLSWNLKRPE
jgi:hypothetical protein